MHYKNKLNKLIMLKQRCLVFVLVFRFFVSGSVGILAKKKRTGRETFAQDAEEMRHTIQTLKKQVINYVKIEALATVSMYPSCCVHLLLVFAHRLTILFCCVFPWFFFCIFALFFRNM